jgi:flagellar hook assembly protein FlgD
MKSIVKNIFIVFSIISMAFAQDFKSHSLFDSDLGNAATWGTSTGPRGIWSGSDLDKDGRMEIFATDYKNGSVHAFEWYFGDTLVHVWTGTSESLYGSTPRWVQTGDTDGDGLGEVIMFTDYSQIDSVTAATGNPVPDSTAGLWVFEWDGKTDNGYTTTWSRNLLTAFADTLSAARPEHFTVADIDSDGKDEIIMASNGGTNPAYGTTSTTHSAYSEDRFIIMGVEGDIGILPSLVEEFSASPRDANKDGVRENRFGGGSPQGVVVADTDGDGKKEAVCFSWNNLSCFIIEATGPNAYTQSDTGYKFADVDDWTLAPTVADVNSDGKDEVYVGSFYKGIVYVVGDKDGDATTFLKTEYAAMDSLATSWNASNNRGNVYALGAAAHNTSFGAPAVFIGHGTGFRKYDFTGTDIFSSASYTKTDYTKASGHIDTLQTGGVNKMFAGSNVDRDKYGEVILAYQGVADSITVDGVKVVNPHRTFLRVLEWDGESTTLSLDDIVLITPEDYKLNQNYPNPFNPTTSIEYTLPIANKISISIYNLMGQEVANILPLQNKPAGTHRATWNGLDKQGNKVASGTYFYSMRYGNFVKTKQMTLMK